MLLHYIQYNNANLLVVDLAYQSQFYFAFASGQPTFKPLYYEIKSSPFIFIANSLTSTICI